jgi:hypothetical protein
MHQYRAVNAGKFAGQIPNFYVLESIYVNIEVDKRWEKIGSSTLWN